MTAPRTALILVGHGSHISPNTAGLVWACVDGLRRLDIADEVTAAFWKEQPSLATVLDSISATDITVVPLFTAQGYFTRTVIPAEMGHSGLTPDPPTPSPSRGEGEHIIAKGTGFDLNAHPSSQEPRANSQQPTTIRYTRTLGEHPLIGEIVRGRVTQALAEAGVPPSEVAVALIGHSTRKNPTSKQATEAQAASVRAAFPVREVAAVYLDDTPSIPEVYALTNAPVLIAVPYFLAAGSHSTIDLPEALGIGSGRTRGEVHDRTVIYTPPLGVGEELVGAVIELAREAGAPLREPGEATEWAGFPQRGSEITRQLLDVAPVMFGQLTITRGAVYPHGDPGGETIAGIGHLRERVRETPFRPLMTSTDLPGGWRVPIDSDSVRLHAVIETVYPGVIGSTAHLLDHGADQAALDKLIARQTGQYRALSSLTEDQRAALVTTVCGRCVLHPVWANQARMDNPLTPLCREPCNVWLSAGIELLNG